MKIAFTLCSNNYYAQALLLGRSFLFHNPDFTFHIGLVDKKKNEIQYDVGGIHVLQISDIEPAIYDLALRYTIVELNTAVKPRYFQHFFSQPATETVIYLDPDIYVYRDMNELSALLDNHDILLTPHILHPIPLDNKKPTEADFLNYGLYNLGFLALKKTGNTLDMLNWWKERTYQLCYHDLAKGLFVDQLWINLVPLFFSRVKIIDHPGYNMGPWNLHERNLIKKEDHYYVNEKYPLNFYHFSNFNPLRDFELHTVLNRFKLAERLDLTGLYRDYAEKLIQNDFVSLNTIPCHYSTWRQEQLSLKQQKDYEKLPASDKMIRKLKKSIPARFRKKLLTWIQK